MVDPIPQPTSTQKANAQLAQVQEDFRILGEGNVSPAAKTKLFEDAHTRMQALASDTTIPQNIRKDIDNVLKEMSSGLAKTPSGASFLGVQTALIREQLAAPGLPPLSPGIVDPTFNPLEPGIVEPNSGKKEPPVFDPSKLVPGMPDSGKKEPPGPGGKEKV